MARVMRRSRGALALAGALGGEFVLIQPRVMARPCQQPVGCMFFCFFGRGESLLVSFGEENVLDEPPEFQDETV